MIVKFFKKTDNDFVDTFTKEETKLIGIELDNGCCISITEHQFGKKLKTPQITIEYAGVGYCMDFDAFINLINKGGFGIEEKSRKERKTKYCKGK